MEKKLVQAKNMTRELELYRSMRRIRTVEQSLIAEYHPADQMRCPVHFCLGQEAAPAALGLALQKDDAIFSHYRNHGYWLAKGCDLKAMVAELYGKASGANRGCGGSMELADHDRHFFSGAIVGGLAGLAVGNAFAQEYRGSDAITVCVFGDGAMDEGATYEAINLAVIKKLPVLFICENNFYAVHSKLGNRTKGDILNRARAFELDGVSCADEDPSTLADIIALAVRMVRQNRIPYFIEVETERRCAHVGAGDDSEYGYEPGFDYDGLGKLRAKLPQNKVDAIDAACIVETQDAIAHAKAAEFPENLVDALSNSYASSPARLVKGHETMFDGKQQETTPGPF